MRIARVAAVLDERTDDELLSLFTTTRDHAAFETLVRRHGGWVLRRCRFWAGDHHAAEDAVQATFLALARRAASVRAGELRPWLGRVAGRAAIRARRTANPRAVRPGSEVPDVPAPEPAPDVSAELAALYEAVASLPRRYVGVATLCFLEGYSVARAAAELGRTPGAADRRQRTAFEKLKAKLAARGVSAAVAVAACRAAVGTTRASAQLIAGTLNAALHGGASPHVLLLSKGAFGATRFKLVAAGMMATVGLALVGVGVGHQSGMAARPNREDIQPAEPKPAPIDEAALRAAVAAELKRLGHVSSGTVIEAKKGQVVYEGNASSAKLVVSLKPARAAAVRTYDITINNRHGAHGGPTLTVQARSRSTDRRILR